MHIFYIRKRTGHILVSQEEMKGAMTFELEKLKLNKEEDDDDDAKQEGEGQIP